MSTRSDQVEATLQRALQDVLARGLNGPRVRGLIGFQEMRAVYFCVNLCRGEAGVSQKLLNRAQIGAISQEMSRK